MKWKNMESGKRTPTKFRARMEKSAISAHLDYISRVIIVSVETGEELFKGDKWHPVAQELITSGLGEVVPCKDYSVDLSVDNGK